MVRPADDDAQAKFLESCIVSVSHIAFVQEPPPDNLPDQFLPRPLLEAVDGIIQFGSFTDQKHAVALIVSTGLVSKHSSGRDAVFRLGTKLMPGHPAEVQRLLDLAPLDNDPMATQGVVNSIIDSHSVGGGASCRGRDLASFAWMDPYTKTTTAQASILVDDEPFDLNKVLSLNHPFHWKLNWPAYFHASNQTLGAYNYMTGEASDIVPPYTGLDTPWNWDTTTTPIPKQYIYEDLRMPTYIKEPAPGISSAGTPNVHAAIFRNILAVKWSGAPAGDLPVTMEYYLQDSTFCQLLFGSLRNGPNGLLTDGGYMRADRITGGWKWISVKYIRFDDLTPGRPQTPGIPDFGQAMNYAAPALLERFISTGLQNSCC